MIMQMVLNPYNIIVFSNEKKWTVDPGNILDGSQGCYAEWKKKPTTRVIYIYFI